MGIPHLSLSLSLSLFKYFVLAGNSGRLARVRYSSRKSSTTHSFLSMCVVFSCVQKTAWLPVFGFNVRTDVDACHCTRGLYRHRKTVCTRS